VLRRNSPQLDNCPEKLDWLGTRSGPPGPRGTGRGNPRVRRGSNLDLAVGYYGPAMDGERAIANCHSPRAALSVAFVLLPKFTLLAFASFIEALRHAADIKDRSRQIHCRWSILGSDQRAIESSCGACITPWESLDDETPYDYIVVVGGLLSGHENASPAIAQYVQRAAARRTPLIGLCTGSFFLARAGLMTGYRCCVSYYHLSEFQNEFSSHEIAVTADALFVVDGPRITCAGGLGVVDLAVHLIEHHLGAQRAQKSMAQMIADNLRPATAPQPRFEGERSLSARNPMARRAVLLMELHICEPLPVSSLAAQLGISVKKLERLFRGEFSLSPASFYRKIRLEIARRMLQETTRPIIDVALECGFGDVSYFGRAFRSALGVSPREFRRQHSSATLPSPGTSTLSAKRE
jgi:transcriptional regulator GlxA family with amidase domain